MFKTPEQLREHIHSIHDYIRNTGTGYGMTALKIFNIFYSLKLLENKSKELGFQFCEWQELKKHNDREKQEINSDFSKFIYLAIEELRNEFNQVAIFSDREKDFTTELYDIVCVLPKQDENINIIYTKLLNKMKYMFLTEKTNKKEIANYIYHQVPENISSSVFSDIFDKVDILFNNNNFDIKGKIYEYFIGRDKSSISDLGAYFTDRPIVNKILESLLPTLDANNNVRSMIDPFGGSGGFTISYLDYINMKYKINWNENKNKIHHWDMAEDVVKIAGTEYFSITGHFPEYGKQFKRVNSFKNEELGKYDYVMSNPPYGGDKTNKTSEMIKKELVIKHNNDIIKQHDTIDNNLIKKILKENKLENINRSIIQSYSGDETIINIITLMIQNHKYKKENEKDSKLLDNQKVNDKTSSNKLKQYIKYIETVYIEQSNKQIQEYKQLNGLDFDYKHECHSNMNDKEACSLALLMLLLNVNGTCVGVLKEGIFFDNKYSMLRHYLINNFNVSEIISVPQDQFENTSTKTTIIIFHNNGITENVNFYEYKVNREPNNVFINVDGETVIDKIENDIINVDKHFLCNATREQISKIVVTYNKKDEAKMELNYSLNYKDYIENVVICPIGYRIVKLGDYIEYKQKSKRNASFADDTGVYNFYTSSDKIKKCKECDFTDNELKIILGTGGNGSLFIDKQFTCSGDNFIIMVKNELLLLYIYYYIKNNWDDYIDKMFSGSVIGHVNKTRLNNYEIPIPINIETIKEELLNLYQLHETIKEENNLIEIKEKEIQEKIKDIIENEECEIKLFKDIVKIFGSPGGEKLGKFKRYENVNDSDLINNYGFIRGCEVSSNSKLKYHIKKNDYEIYYKNTNNIVKTHDLLICACSQNISFLKIPIEWNNYPYHGCIRITNINININYLINYMKSDIFKNNILKQQNGSVVKYSNASHYNKMIINIPKDESIIENLEIYFREIENLKLELNENEQLYKLKIQELFSNFN
jgi:type I restriction-modification system DNA methylase subunit